MENPSPSNKKVTAIYRRYLFVGCLVVAGVLGGFFLDRFSHDGSLGKDLLSLADNCPTDLHYSYFSTKPFFEDAYKSASALVATSTPAIKTGAATSAIKGILVNHHLLAPNLIAQAMETVATNDPVTVVLVSPNHFGAGKGKIISSLYTWETPYGVLDSDCAAISELQKQGVLNVDEMPFGKEHGVSGIVPFIKKSLPNAQVIPIIVKDNLSEADLNAFVEKLYATLGNKLIIVGSFDFSHYLPDTAAQFHDAKSLAVIQNFDYANIKALDTDSVPGLTIVLKYLEKEGAQRFDLLANTNSAQVLHDPSIDETTSYITGTFSIGAKNLGSKDIVDDGAAKNKDASANADSATTATILAFGDMMLDRGVRQRINENGAEYPFTPLKRFLIGSDIVVANAEGPFTVHPSETLGVPNAPFKFTFDPGLLPTLKKLGFTLFSLANNHTLNFGQEALRKSEDFIDAAGLNWFGDPLNKNTDAFITTIRGQKIAFIGYHQFTGGGLDRVLRSIESAKQQGAFVIVYPHWGTEYEDHAGQTQITIAHAFVDAGADLILGAHPHVIQPIEVYKDKAIFYSMGNFIFDQRATGPTSQGLSVGISITPSEVRYFLFPLTIQKGQAALMKHASRARLLGSLAEDSLVSSETKNNITNGAFILKRP